MHNLFHGLQGQDTSKEQNLTKSKRALTSLGEIAIQGGAIAAGVPGVGIAYKTIKILVEYARAYYNDRRNDRIKDFHEKVLSGVPDDQREEFLAAEFSVEDYYALLEKAVQDEEDSKVEIYAKLFRCLILGLIPDDYKLHVVKTARELNFSDFEFMRKLYINDKYEFIGPGNKLSQISNLTSSANPLRSYSVQTLIRLGFLNERQTNRPPWPNDLLKILVELLYDKESLTAESLGAKVKTADSEHLKVFFAYSDLPDESAKILGDLADRLHGLYIKSVIALPNKKSFPLTLAPMIAVCVSPKCSPIDNLRAFTNLEKKTVVQLLMPGARKEDLPFKEATTFDLGATGLGEKERFIKFVADKFGN